MALSDGHHFLYEVVEPNVPRKRTVSGDYVTDDYACGCRQTCRNDIPDDGNVTLCSLSEAEHENWKSEE